MLTDRQMQRIATEIFRALQEEQVDLHRTPEEIEGEVIRILVQNMEEERKINAACDKIMDQYAREIDRGNADPHKLFLMIKKKVAKETGFVL
jgi:hypothetical protein